jgi:hypothetical protein
MRKPILSLSSMLVAAALSACSSFGPSTPPPSRPIDALRDDVAGLLIVFDLPRGLGPMPGASFLTFTVGTTRPVTAALIPADADAMATQLPPPGKGRAYYFLDLSPIGQTAMRTAQAGARAANPAPSSVALAVVPGLCESEAVDPKLVTLSVFAAVPGASHLVPLIDHRLVADIVGSAGKLSACP